MAEPTTKQEILKSHERGLTKTYHTYDVNNRIEYTYTAVVQAVTGSPCLVTRVSYSGLTSRVVYSKEYYSTWDTAWETF